jgi:hypothetical protein
MLISVPYQTAHQAPLITIFRQNSPKYFDPEDEASFVDFLNRFTDQNFRTYFLNDQIIGCGGHYTTPHKHGIAWVLFSPHSFGARHLMRYVRWIFRDIVNRIKAENVLLPIEIATTQLMAPLFSRFGFTVTSVKPNGFGPGLDEVQMQCAAY